MKLYALLILVVALLLFFIGEPVLAQMNGTQQMGGKGKASDMMEYGKTARTQQGMHGLGFMHSAGNAYGEYVTFTIDNQTGAVLDYGIMGTALFNMSIAGFNYRSTSTMGSITRVISTDGSTFIQLHDNPAAVINILTNKSITVTFTLAEGATPTKEDNLVKIESGNIVGYIAGTGIVTSTVSGSQVKINASPDSAVIFRTAPVNFPMSDQMNQRFTQEIARNRVGMEIALGRNGSFNAINYSSGILLRDQEMLQDRIRLRINATGQAGPILAINLDNTSLQIGERERLRIYYDGKPLDCVNDPNVVFNGANQPLCWISQIQDSARAQVMLYVPTYSEHTIEIAVEPEGTPAATANVTMTTEMSTPKAQGFEFVLSLAGVMILYLLVRRRDK